jgi:uncharacterized repeat protein (TIGR03803 family)
VTHFRVAHLALFIALSVALLASPAVAQVERVIYNFQGAPTDGYFPNGGLIRDAQGNLYGTTVGGGLYANGTVFELKPKAGGGWTEVILYNFANSPDGAYPNGLVFDKAGNLYGSTYYGGSNASLSTGIVYELSPPATGQTEWTETVLWDFSAEDFAAGSNPTGPLVFDAKGNLYGTAATGGGGDGAYCGDPGCGSIFQLQPPAVSGGAWTLYDIHDFLVSPNTDGIAPQGVIVTPAGTIYGDTVSGAQWFQGQGYGPLSGTVFRLRPPKSGNGQWTETILATFGTPTTNGVQPYGMTLGKNGSLYLAMFGGGAFNDGAIIQLSPPVSGTTWTETVLHNFTGGADGTAPLGAPFLDTAGNLYATAVRGGTNQCVGSTSGCGTFIKLTPQGAEHTLFQFSQTQGYGPRGSLLLQNGFLIGGAQLGGNSAGSGAGTIYQVKP